MTVVLNVAPIQFEDGSIEIEEFRYSDNQFEQLLNQYRNTEDADFSPEDTGI